MDNDIKSGIGYIIPAAGVVGFFIALFMEETLASIIITICGILLWFLYMLVMESTMPKQMGNMIILFGVMLSTGIFLNFGVLPAPAPAIKGVIFEPEGSILSLIILFFSVLTGMNFRNQQLSSLNSSSNPVGLSDEDRNLVMDAINRSQKTSSRNNEEPRVIVVKQEAQPSNDKPETEKLPPSQNLYDTYAMGNNPYFAYPPDYYYDDDDDDEYEDDWDEYEYEED